MISPYASPGFKISYTLRDDMELKEHVLSVARQVWKLRKDSRMHGRKRHYTEARHFVAYYLWTHTHLSMAEIFNTFGMSRDNISRTKRFIAEAIKYETGYSLKIQQALTILNR